MTSRIETEFDLDDWLEGAKDAYWSVHHLLSEEDYASLQGAVSAKLLAAMEGTTRDYRAAGMVWKSQLDPEEPIQARICSMSLWTREEIAEYDEAAAAATTAAGGGAEGGVEPGAAAAMTPAGRWLVLMVQYKSRSRVEISRVEDGAVVARMSDSRPSYYRFACGPLPPGMPVRRLDTPWWLVDLV